MVTKCAVMFSDTQTQIVVYILPQILQNLKEKLLVDEYNAL